MYSARSVNLRLVYIQFLQVIAYEQQEQNAALNRKT